MAVADLTGRWALIMGGRALLMLLAGICALIWPGMAIAVLVAIGGVILVADGALGLWALTFGGARTGNHWFDVIRNVLAILTGILILLSPILAALLTAWFFVYLLAFQSILVGAMEITLAIHERALYARIWPILVSGLLYVLFGLILLFAPLTAASFFVAVGGVLMILFSIPLFVLAWRLRRGGRAAVA